MTAFTLVLGRDGMGADFEIGAVHISLCDPLNPAFGYQIQVEDRDGITRLHTSRAPDTGADLLTYADALRVAGLYGREPAGESTSRGELPRAVLTNVWQVLKQVCDGGGLVDATTRYWARVHLDEVRAAAGFET